MIRVKKLLMLLNQNQKDCSREVFEVPEGAQEINKVESNLSEVYQAQS